MAIRLGIGNIDLRNIRSGFSWSQYWASRKVLSSSGRDGLTIPSSIGDDLSIHLPYLDVTNGRGYFITDNGALNIANVGATGFSLCGWVKSNTTNKSTIRAFAGKGVSGTTANSYYIGVNTGTGVFRTLLRDGAANSIVINSAIDSTTAGLTFLTLTIDKTNKLIRFYVNNDLIGDPVSYPTAFGALDNKYMFCVGSANSGVGDNIYSYPAIASFGDWYVFPKTLSTEEIATLIAGGSVSGATAHWPFNEHAFDVSGNNYHLTKTYGFLGSYKYDNTIASKYSLGHGYSVWKRDDSEDVYVPYLNSGTPMTDPKLPAGYTKYKDYPYDANKINLLPCKIRIADDNWDKSDETKFNIFARNTIYYDATHPGDWHTKEFNQFRINGYCVASHIGIPNVIVSANSITNRESLVEIFSLSEQPLNYDQLLKYTGDETAMPEDVVLDYYYTDIHYAAVDGNKIFAFDEANSLLKLSLDKGETWVNTIDVSGVITIITYAVFFPNGNILFCDHTKAYYSDDNLVTYNESTVLDIAGNPFVPTATENFWSLHKDATYEKNGATHVLFSNYALNAATEYININVWRSRDSGLTVESIYKGDVTTPIGALVAPHIRHSHGVTRNPHTGKIYFITGDWVDECCWIEGVDDPVTDVITWTLLRQFDSISRFKSTGLAFIDGYVIWGGDVTSYNAENGIWKCLIEDIGDESKQVKIFDTTINGGGGFYSNHVNEIIALMAGGKHIVVSNDGINFHPKFFIGGPDVNTGAARNSYYAFGPGKLDGYYRGDIYEDTEVANERTKGVCIMLKIL